MLLGASRALRLAFVGLALTVALVLAGVAPSEDADVPSRRHHARREVASALASATSPTRRGPTFRFPYGGASQGAQTVRGVSLGGWLVVESFIAPSVYAQTGPANNGVVDEWTFGKLVPRDKATRILQNHLDTFITEQDFADIARAGLNHVRIPIGFWAFDVRDPEPYVKLNQWDLLKRACGWAAKYGLKVMVDLHGAPGSQNGFDHSGRVGRQRWDSNPDNIPRTLAIIKTMSSEFSKPQYASSVASIEVLNEPFNVDIGKLKQFYADAYNAIRGDGNIVMTFGDTFVDPGNTQAWNGLWRDFGRPPQYEGVMEDSHLYIIFSDGQLKMNDDQRVSYYCSRKSAWARGNRFHWQITGEFTPAWTDCAYQLNGRNIGARWDGTRAGSTLKRSCAGLTGDASKFSANTKERLRKFFEVQTDAYEAGSGWVAWTWKTEKGTAEEWSYQKGLQYGWIKPQRKYRC